jgi:hypothetical protein
MPVWKEALMGLTGMQNVVCNYNYKPQDGTCQCWIVLACIIGLIPEFYKNRDEIYYVTD